jgi:hypothetical protein
MDPLSANFRSLNLEVGTPSAIDKTPPDIKSQAYAPGGIPFVPRTGPTPYSVFKLLGNTQTSGFNFIAADDMLDALKEKEHISPHQLNEFYKSWNQLTTDPYYVQHGIHYHRRHYTLLRVSHSEN